MVHGDEGAEALGEALRLDRGPVRLAADGAGRQRAVLAALGFRQELDEGGVQIVSAGSGHQLGRRRPPPGSCPRPWPTSQSNVCGLLHVGGGDQHAHAWPAGPEAVDEVPELTARQRVDAGGRLVEDQERRVVDQRAAEAELLLHPPRELAGWPIPEPGQAGAREKLVDPPGALLPRLAEQPAEEVHVLDNRERRVEIPAQALGHVGDPRGCPGPDARVIACCRRVPRRSRSGSCALRRSGRGGWTCRRRRGR